MPFKPGQSGNPKGRPPKPLALTTAIRQCLRKKGPDGIVYRRRIAQKLVELADAGNVEAIRILLDRIDGKVPDALDVRASGELVVRYVNDWRNPET